MGHDPKRASEPPQVLSTTIYARPLTLHTVHWPGLAARLRGEEIVDLWYDPAAGLLVILLEGGRSVLVNADWEGYQIVVIDLCPQGTNPTSNGRLEWNKRG